CPISSVVVGAPSPNGRRASGFRGVLGLALAFRGGHSLEFDLGHRVDHRLRRTLQVALLGVATLGGEGCPGSLLLGLRFGGHDVPRSVAPSPPRPPNPFLTGSFPGAGATAGGGAVPE